MKRVKTVNGSTLKQSLKRGGCGECQTSCQSACKTSCTVGNQTCESIKLTGGTVLLVCKLACSGSSPYGEGRSPLLTPESIERFS